jgi:hypothetical protein
MSDQVELAELRKKVKGLEKEISAIRDILNTKDNWHAEIKDLLEKAVTLRTTSGVAENGILKWTDRYNLCIETEPVAISPSTKTKARRYVFSKGAIEFIRLAD